MKYQLTAREARLIGALLEKQVTTADQYPLSLNSIVAACNQKSNREPVMNLDEREVQETLDHLVRTHYVRIANGSGSRVVRYEQRFCNSGFGNLRLSDAEIALVTTLLLRGPQTPGELRSRCARMHEFNDMTSLEQTLERLITREDGPFVVRLAREPGKRESRYAHLFGDNECATVESVPKENPCTDDSCDLEQRLVCVEQEVAQLRQRLDTLLARLGE